MKVRLASGCFGSPEQLVIPSRTLEMQCRAFAWACTDSFDLSVVGKVGTGADPFDFGVVVAGATVLGFTVVDAGTGADPLDLTLVVGVGADAEPLDFEVVAPVVITDHLSPLLLRPEYELKHGRWTWKSSRLEPV